MKYIKETILGSTREIETFEAETVEELIKLKVEVTKNEICECTMDEHDVEFSKRN